MAGTSASVAAARNADRAGVNAIGRADGRDERERL
jgi:hypothetical protein